MSNVEYVDLSKEVLYRDVSNAVLYVRHLHWKLVIYYQPFRIELLHSLDGTLLASFNAESRMQMDAFDERPPSPSPSPSPLLSPSPIPSPSNLSDDTANKEDSADNVEDTKSDGTVKDPPHPNTADGTDTGDVGDGLDDDISDAQFNGDDYEYDMDDGASHEKPSQSPNNLEPSVSTCDGCWQETFKTHTDSKLRGPESVGVDVNFPFANHLYGIPERTSKFSLGDTVDDNDEILSEPYRLYNLDVFEFELDKPFGLYGSVPFIIARKGKMNMGMLWLNTAETYVDIKSNQSDSSGIGKRTHWYSETGLIDTFLIPGPTLTDVFKQYLSLTGAPAMPQRFALGYHQCRWNYRDEQDAKSVDAGFDDRDIPYDVLWLDIEHTDGKRYFTWDLGRFPDPTGLQNHIAARGRKMVTIIDPHVKRDNKYSLHRIAQEKKLYVTKPDGKAFDGWCWPGSSSYFDFTCPRVRDVWGSRFNPIDYPHFTEHLYTWNDMNEPSVFNGPELTMQKDLIHVGNTEHRHVHNYYGHFFMEATFEGLKKGHGGNDRPFVLSRSFYAGSQRFGAVWTGDNTATWDHLESSVRMLLSLQISGIIFSGADVGGFFGNPSAELLTRWYQAGAFQPFFRGHAHMDTNRREPWLFGEPYTTHISTAIKARYQFIPFWYTLFAGNALKSTVGFKEGNAGPPMRPMWWEFGEDPECDSNQRQWMIGNALLVAPVVNEGASTHDLYVPSGEEWYDLYNPNGYGMKVNNVGRMSIPVTLGRMVVFQKGGTIVPKQERLRRSTVAMSKDPFTLVVALNASGEAEGELYLDDGRTYDYESSSYTLRYFKYSGDELVVETISGGEKEYVGNNAEIERIVIFGFGEKGPKGVKSEEKCMEFVFAKATGALTIQRVGLAAGKGSWKISVER